MSQAVRPASPPTGPPGTAPSSATGSDSGSDGGSDGGSRRIVLTAVLGTVVCSLVGAALGPSAAYGTLGGLFAVLLATTAALYPVFATYTYVVTLSILAGIDRDTLLPLVRPNEGILAVVMAGAMIGAFLRYLRGDEVRPRFYPMVDVPLAVFLLMCTVWPMASLTLRGQVPDGQDLASLLPMTKLVGIYFLVRYTITTESRVLRTIRFIVWPSSVVALIAVLQTLRFGPVISLLETLWSSADDATATEALGERGTSTLGSPIATGDVIIISLVLVLCCGARGVLGRRERLFLALVLGTGVFAAGQFSTWIAAAVALALLAWRFPELRRQATRFAPLGLVALLIGAPAFLGRLDSIGEYGPPVPESWLGRYDNLRYMYLPHFDPLTTMIGVSPNWVLEAPERWREVIYLESGILWFLWVGGIPLLAAFLWLSARILRSLHPALGYPGGFGSVVSTLDIVWRFLLVLTLLDPHLQQRGTGDLIFVLLGIAVTGLDVRGIVDPPRGMPSFMLGKRATPADARGAPA
jgi:hypothetical protein